jgi:hypothetical protein
MRARDRRPAATDRSAVTHHNSYSAEIAIAQIDDRVYNSLYMALCSASDNRAFLHFQQKLEN